MEMAIAPQIIKFMGGASATGDEEKEREIFHWIFDCYSTDQDDKVQLFWGVHENDRLCAHVQLKDTIWTNKDELEVVYMVHPTERKRGLMTEVLATLSDEQPR